MRRTAYARTPHVLQWVMRFRVSLIPFVYFFGNHQSWCSVPRRSFFQGSELKKIVSRGKQLKCGRDNNKIIIIYDELLEDVALSIRLEHIRWNPNFPLTTPRFNFHGYVRSHSRSSGTTSCGHSAVPGANYRYAINKRKWTSHVSCTSHRWWNKYFVRRFNIKLPRLFPVFVDTNVYLLRLSELSCVGCEIKWASPDRTCQEV